MATGVDGLASGIDTSSMISKIMAAARAPITTMEQQVSQMTFKRAKFQTLNSLLDTLNEKIEASMTADDLAAYTASSTQDGIAIEVTGDAAPGTHRVQVHSLATASNLSSDGLAEGEVLQDGTLTVTVGSESTEVTISAAEGTNTLEGLADYLNANVDGAGAYVLDTGDAAGPYRLMMQGLDTGDDAAVSLSYAGSGGAGAVPTFSEDVAAADAHITLDGVDVYTATNTPNGLVPGVDVTLTAETDGVATVSISRDSSAMADKVSEIVDAYNNVMRFINDETAVNDGQGSTLTGDSTVRKIERELQNIFAQGFQTGDVTSIRQVGITGDNNGVLTFDASTFGDMLASSYADTLAIFTADDGFLDRLHNVVDVVTDPDTGVIQGSIDGIDSHVDALNARIEDQEDRLSSYEETLRTQFTSMELAISKFNALGDYLTQQFDAMSKNNK